MCRKVEVLVKHWTEVVPVVQNLTMEDIDDYLYHDAFNDAPVIFLDCMRGRICEIMDFRNKLYAK